MKKQPNNLLEEMEFQSLPCDQIIKYRQDGNVGLWADHETKILQTEYQIGREYMKTILPAAHGSIVAHVINGYCQTQFIVHVSAKGEILKQLRPRGYNFHFAGMLTPDLVLIYNRGYENYEIIQLNLQTYEQVAVKCSQIFGIRLFKDRELFCSCCYTNANQNKIQIDYFRYPLKSQKDAPQYSTSLTLPSDLKNFKFVKLNQNSMVGLIPWEESKEFFTVILQNLSESKCFQVPASLVQFQEGQSVRISDIWEIGCGVIFLQLSVMGFRQIKRQADFIWNYRQDKFRRASFDFQGLHMVQMLGQFRRIESISSIRSNEGKGKIYPIFYVDMMTQQVMAIERALFDDQRRKIINSYANYAPQLQYLFTCTRNGLGHHVKATVRKLEWPKIQTNLVIAFLLENIIESCDDDLIFEAIRLIVANQYQKNEGEGKLDG